MGFYCTAAELRGELDIDADDLPDLAAERLIGDAEDLVDNELGKRPIDPVTGRAVDEAAVQPWQWEKISRATVKLAALLFFKPELASEQQWKNVSGPDFSFSGTNGPLWGPLIVALINGARLTRARGAYSVPTRPPCSGPTLVRVETS